MTDQLAGTTPSWSWMTSQVEPQISTQGQGIGTHLQLLHPGDARVGIVQISRTNTAPGQQLRA